MRGKSKRRVSFSIGTKPNYCADGDIFVQEGGFCAKPPQPSTEKYKYAGWIIQPKRMREREGLLD
ncbi:hypothetical protein AKJ43_01460 [candidate division MSBL1 archaeon SCGC-AAA261D19]|uniref:Uncharacterized protein n=1 Tax=candidate division MSBL1 archaeon SCGC-AAA261D19 TaxID=1698273 RepID=A0A133V834_9EURY|nr:hypothetical protein AKJ43_01460 [candidate division MSBL1 archaeon SCGC-AAA261D19]